MEHNTYIDTIGIQVDLDCNKKQKEILSSIYIHLQKNSMFYIEYEDKIVNIGTKRIINREYYIRFKGKTFASIRTGSFRTGSYHKNDFQDMFYINITFAGLKSYNELLDEVSISTLFHVVGYLNANIDVNVDNYSVSDKAVRDCEYNSLACFDDHFLCPKIRSFHECLPPT